MAAPPGRPGASRQPRRPATGQPRDQLARDRHLGVGVLGEVLVAEQLDVAPGRRDGGRVRLPLGRAGAVPGTPARGSGCSILPRASSGSVLLDHRPSPNTAVNASSKRSRSRWLRAQHGAQRQPRVLARACVDRRQRPVGGRAARRRRRASPGPASPPPGRSGAAPPGRPGGRRRRRRQTPSSTFRSRTRTTSSWTLSAAPSVSSRSASSPSAISACAHTIVSPTPGSL